MPRTPFPGAETAFTSSQSFGSIPARWSGTQCVLWKPSPLHQIQGRQRLSQTAIVDFKPGLQQRQGTPRPGSLLLWHFQGCLYSVQTPSQVSAPHPGPIHPPSGTHAAAPTRAHNACSRKAKAVQGPFGLYAALPPGHSSAALLQEQLTFFDNCHSRQFNYRYHPPQLPSPSVGLALSSSGDDLIPDASSSYILLVAYLPGGCFLLQL